MLDDTHIPITAPEDGYRDFINRKYYASYNVQALCDDRLIICDLCVKHPGSNHDAAVFRDSSLFVKLNSLAESSRFIGGIHLPLHIIGDPAYPVMTKLIKPYPGKSSTLTQQNESFNVYHSAARNVIKKTFGRLKSRWRRLLKKMDLHAETAPTIIAAAFFLHNICELSTICRYSKAWDYDTDPELRRQIQLLPQPEQRILDDPAGSVECHE